MVELSLPWCRADVDPEHSSRPAISPTSTLLFDDVYETHVAFVIRSLAALGVPAAQRDDAAQEVFLVVHRKLATFEGRAELRTWIYRIVIFVARAFRRSAHQRYLGEALDVFPLAEVLASPHCTARDIEEADELRRLARGLAALDEDKREVLVLAQLEELSVPEIAEALGENVNTIYTRLRSARQALVLALSRDRARERRT